MFTTYGKHKTKSGWALLSGANAYPPLPPPAGVYSEKSSRCLGCPYPHHGLVCGIDKDGGCLRSDMQELDAKHRMLRQQ